MIRIDRAAVGIALLLLVLNGAAYFRAPTLAFVEWDDQGYIYRNAIVQRGLTWDGVRYAWTTMDSGNYIPITWMSYLVDVSMFGNGPAGLHVVNVILHAVNCWLLFLLVRSWTGEIATSTVVAMLFAVHPLHVESVAWVSERKDVLSTLFLLLTLLAYGRYVQAPAVARYLLVATPFALGLLTKSMLVTLPILLWLVDWILYKRFAPVPVLGATTSKRALIVEKLPLLGMSIACGIITIVAQRKSGAAPDTIQLAIVPRLLNMLDSYGWYVWKTLWPSHLSPFYPHRLHQVDILGPTVATLLMAALTWIAYRVGRQQRIVWFGLLWFVISLLPVIGLLQVGMQAHADRYVYVPHIGLLATLVWLVRDAIAKASAPSWLNSALATVAVLSGLWLTSRQVVVWKDTESLWRQALLVDPENGRAHSQLGLALSKSGRGEEATPHLEQAAQMGVLRDVALNELGEINERSGDLEKAAEYYRKALEANPGHAAAAVNLTVLDQKRKGKSVSEEVLRQQVAKEPNSSENWNRLGLSQMRSGNATAALQSFQKAVEVNPQDARSQTNLGLALWQSGNLRDARQHLAEAVRLSPGDVSARMNLADALESLGDRAGAMEHLQEASRLNPQDVQLTERLKQLSGQQPKR